METAQGFETAGEHSHTSPQRQRKEVVFAEQKGRHHPGTTAGFETGLRPKVKRKGNTLPSSHPPISCQCPSVTEPSWKLADFRGLGDVACRGHRYLAEQKGSGTGSGRNENGMAVFGMGRR